MSLSVKGTSAQVISRKKPNAIPSQKLQRSKTSETVDNVDNVSNYADQYATSLKQQIQLLQYENNFLKQQRISEQNQVYERPKTKSTQILTRGNQISLNGETWCQLPPFHPSLNSMMSDGSSQKARARTSETFTRERQDDSARCFHHSRSTSISRDRPTTVHIGDADLLRDLEEAANNNRYLESQLKLLQDREEDHQKVINSLSMKIKELEEDKVSEHEAASMERRALMEEVMELQKRIDELTPAIAEKEMKIFQCENEKLELGKRLRIVNSDVSVNQMTISQLNEDVLMKDNKVKKSEEEVRFLAERLITIEAELRDMRTKEAEHHDRISGYVQEVREFELTRQNDKKLIDQLMAENTAMIKENARISTALSRLEQKERSFVQMEAKESSLNNETISELRSSLQIEKNHVTALVNNIESLKQRCADLEINLRERDKSDDDNIAERTRVERELNALHALSKSLSAENKLLREEKLSCEEIIDEFRGKIRALEASIKSSQQIFNEKEKQYSSRILELEEDSMKKHQKYLEFEELSKTLHQITAMMPSKTSIMTNECGKK